MTVSSYKLLQILRDVRAEGRIIEEAAILNEIDSYFDHSVPDFWLHETISWDDLDRYFTRNCLCNFMARRWQITLEGDLIESMARHIGETIDNGFLDEITEELRGINISLEPGEINLLDRALNER